MNSSSCGLLVHVYTIEHIYRTDHSSVARRHESTDKMAATKIHKKSFTHFINVGAALSDM